MRKTTRTLKRQHELKIANDAKSNQMHFGHTLDECVKTLARGDTVDTMYLDLSKHLTPYHIAVSWKDGSL